MYNSVEGPKKKEIKMYTTYCNPRPNNSFKIGIYGGLPAVISKECTRKEVYVVNDVCAILSVFLP